MCQFAKDAHKRASRMLGYALTLDDRRGWRDAAVVWAARLTVGERAAMALAAPRSLDPQEAEFIAALALGYTPESEGV